MTKMLPVHLKGTNSSERETDPISTSLKAELEINSIQGAMSAREAPSPPQEPTSTFDPSTYTKPFIEFISNNPTVFHAVSHFSSRLASQGFTQLSERKPWSSQLEPGGSYFLDRNGSGIIAFKIGENYKPGNGVAIIAAHIDALTAKIKPVSIKPKKLGFVELGVAQYGGALNQTWIDRDLGIGGRVFVRDGSTGKVEIQLMKLDWPIARIPSIAPHFGIPAQGSPNREVRMVPIIGIDNGDLDEKDEKEVETKLIAGSKGKFADTQPESLIKAVAGEIRVKNSKDIINWELELFDIQPAQLGGLSKEMIFAGRIDDKLCSFSAIESLLLSSTKDSSIIKLVGLFDDEEVGSLLRQGARSNFLPSTIERISSALSKSSEESPADTLYTTYANSFMLSADVIHAFNPNYSDVYLENHSPRLNVGVAVSFDSNAHMTTDGFSYSFLQRIAEKSGSVLQGFQIRNDSRSGGTVGPMLSAATGVRSIDCGIPQLSMHSIRATTGAKDPGLGVKLFAGFFDHYEEVDGEFN